ncbi:MAG: hypothetical protein R2939_18760 [Kofleriaceae bacterium]
MAKPAEAARALAQAIARPEYTPAAREVPAVIELLVDERVDDPRREQHAVRALGRVERAIALAALRERLGGPGTGTGHARLVRALGQLGAGDDATWRRAAGAARRRRRRAASPPRGRDRARQARRRRRARRCWHTSTVTTSPPITGAAWSRRWARSAATTPSRGCAPSTVATTPSWPAGVAARS